MTHDETREFIDCVAHGEARVKYHEKIYFCDGVATDFDTGECRILIFQEEPVPDDDNWHDWCYRGKSRDECMKAFTDVKYWDGRSFYEAAPEMEWVD